MTEIINWNGREGKSESETEWSRPHVHRCITISHGDVISSSWMSASVPMGNAIIAKTFMRLPHFFFVQMKLIGAIYSIWSSWNATIFCPCNKCKSDACFCVSSLLSFANVETSSRTANAFERSYGIHQVDCGNNRWRIILSLCVWPDRCKCI